MDSNRAGTLADIVTNNFVCDPLSAAGFSVQTAPFDVLFTTPIAQSPEIISPEKRAFNLLEGDPAHHNNAERLAGLCIC